MINPLSYQPGTKFSGKILNDWLSFQIANHGSHEKIAQKIDKHFILKDNRVYELVYIQYHSYDNYGYPGFMRSNI